MRYHTTLVLASSEHTIVSVCLKSDGVMNTVIPVGAHRKKDCTHISSFLEATKGDLPRVLHWRVKGQGHQKHSDHNDDHVQNCTHTQRETKYKLSS